jgi:hypothetical protein
MFLKTTAACTNKLKYLLQLVCLKRILSVKPDLFVSPVFPLPEGSQASTAPWFRRLEKDFFSVVLLLFEP